MIDYLSLLALTFGSVFFFAKRALRYLRFFQLEDYSAIRFLRWVRRRRAFDRRASLALGLGAATALLAPGLPSWAIGAVVAAALVLLALLEEDPRKSGKVLLSMTERARRIYVTALAIYSSAAILLTFSLPNAPLAGFLLLHALLVQTQPLWLLAANAALMPGERRLQEQLLADASRILKEVHPYVVGITGSYGKTSTKAILGRMLTGLGPTFWPAKSINTPMGITREIRQGLRPEHHFAVFELGAYYQGSIKRLCDFVGPSAGIITTVGLMHLERFGSEEAIYQAKAELARAIPEDGILVCNGDSEGARRMAHEHPKRVTLLYGLDTGAGGLACWMSDIRQESDGTQFIIHGHGRQYAGFTRLLGRPMLSNILGAFTLAMALGCDPHYCLAVIRNLEGEKNRLSITRDGGIVILNDAYNSNPVGFAAALDVLATMPGARKLLITPGMIELGPRQREENYRMGISAASRCSIVLLVGSTNRAALLEGLRAGGFPVDDERVMLFDEMREALRQLRIIGQPGDVVLIENDLPDLYEGSLGF